MPIPWVSPPDNLAEMNGPRMTACASGAVCQVCGLGYDDDETAFVLVRREGDNPPDLSKVVVEAMDNGVLHERCLRVALAWCPRLKKLRADGMLRAVTVEAHAARFKRIKGHPTATFAGTDCQIFDLDSL